VSPVAASAAVPIPDAIRVLLDAPNFVHLSTLRKDGSPRNWIVWVGLEGHQILVCTSDLQAKAADMRRDPRVGLSVADSANPYQMAVLQGRVVEMRPDHDCVDMDPIAIKYTGAPVPEPRPAPRLLRDFRRVGLAADARVRTQTELGTHHVRALRRRSGRAEHRRLSSSSRHPA
jgi:PPOX class probable F420-dependent enzyme